MALPDDVRDACARVAARARRVHIVKDAIEEYARSLPAAATDVPDLEGGDLERRAAFSLTLNAINFGSGWFPTLRKPAGLSGFRTVEAGVREHGPWPAAELATFTAARVAGALGQEPEHELMALYATALRELGSLIREAHGGSFLALAQAGGGSAVRLAEELARWPTWHDASVHDGGPVPFYKRAQIAAADLHLQGIAPAEDLDRLTMFADNLVPHVLRLDGVLEFEPALVARIEASELLDHGSPEEVEIRACTVHTVELLVAAHGATTAASVDNALWNRGAGERYKAAPRHRTRCTAY